MKRETTKEIKTADEINEVFVFGRECVVLFYVIPVFVVALIVT